MKKIVLAIDSYKGCLSSKEVETCVEQELHVRFPDCKVVCFPVADGGEGLLEALAGILDMRIIHVKVHDPLMRTHDARYGILEDGVTAVIEMAEASGLPLVAVPERDPMRASTFGTGELIADALQKGCRKFLTGIGGSATNDAGMGMLEALGVRFFDENGTLLHGSGESMCRISCMDLTLMDNRLKEADFQVACDVDNPFCGERGAAHVFAPQKGASPEQIRRLDEGMRRFAALMRRTLGKDVSCLAGAGAAGGLGGALCAFLGARLLPGIDVMLDAARFDEVLPDASLVITGEGCSDLQTLMGKVPSGILRRAQRFDVPVCLMSGRIEEKDALLRAGFAGLFEASPSDMPLEEAVKPETAKENLRRSVQALARLMEDKL